MILIIYNKIYTIIYIIYKIKIIPKMQKKTKTIRFSISKINEPKIYYDPLKKLYLYSCKICPFTTFRAFNFTRHLKFHKKKSREGPFIIIRNRNIQHQKDINNDSNADNIIDEEHNNNICIKIERDTIISPDTNNIKIDILLNVFSNQKHLNCQEIEMENYFVFNNHALGTGSFGTIFLGSNKTTKNFVAIKQINKSYYYSYKNEKNILTSIRGTGNFPEFYDSFESKENYYIVENLFGPSLDFLLDMCDGAFDLFTTINIGIDAIKNIQILHGQGFLHRDLKPNNLAFGSLSKYN